MPSTDIDGSVIVILSTEEAQFVYRCLAILAQGGSLTTNPVAEQLANKLARDLQLPYLTRKCSDSLL